MVVNNTYELVKLIQSSDAKDAENLLIRYGNQRSEKSIEDAWTKFRGMIKFMIKKDNLSTKDYLLCKDEDNTAFISVRGLHKYLYKIDNEMKRIAETCSGETLEALASIEDVMEVSLGNIKIDHRLSFSKED